MQYGILCTTVGRVKRTWAIVSGACSVPVEDGDILIEWEVDHDEMTPEPLLREERIARVLKYHGLVHALQTYDQTVAHGQTQQRAMTARTLIVSMPQGPLLYDSRLGLYTREIDANGDEQVSPVHYGVELKMTGVETVQEFPFHTTVAEF